MAVRVVPPTTAGWPESLRDPVSARTHASLAHAQHVPLWQLCPDALAADGPASPVLEVECVTATLDEEATMRRWAPSQWPPAAVRRDSRGRTSLREVGLG